jgi:hypothetical protein
MALMGGLTMMMIILMAYLYVCVTYTLATLAAHISSQPPC